jgi:hypothetical protein
MSLEGINKDEALADLKKVFSKLFKDLKFVGSTENPDGSLTVKMKGGPQKGEWEHTILNIKEPEAPKKVDPQEWRDICKIVFT